MRPERPECQCLACAQLQHHQANDTLLLFAIGTVLVMGGLVWLVGQVAGLLASGVWPDVPLAELPRILARLREHAGDPAAAWPAKVRGGLPGPVGMYATLAGILATPVALGCWRGGCTSHPPRPGRQPPPPARPAGAAAGRPPRRAHVAAARARGGAMTAATVGARADRARRPRQQWRGRAGTARHQPRGGPPLRSHPPA